MNLLRIKETCIYVSDLNRTKQFYHDLLGLPVIALIEGRHVFFRAGDSVLLCFIAAATEKESSLPPHGAKGSLHFAFEVSKEDYSSTLNEISSKGIDLLHEQEWKNNIRSFYFHDPDKNLVEVVEEGLWG